MENIIHVYSDGACRNNGKYNACAGYGVYFGLNDERNVSKRLDSHCKQTNNTAELMGAITALKIVQDYPMDVLIHIDSDYVKLCATSYGFKCAKKGWREDFPNKELVKELYELYTTMIGRVKFIHVKAHTNGSDIHSIGNRWADRLANESLN